jgi:hypothetical protein
MVWLSAGFGVAELCKLLGDLEIFCYEKSVVSVVKTVFRWVDKDLGFVGEGAFCPDADQQRALAVKVDDFHSRNEVLSYKVIPGLYAEQFLA